MKIKTKLVITYSYIIIFFAIFWIVSSVIEYNVMNNDNVKFINSSIDKSINETFNVLNKANEPFARKYVDLKTELLLAKVQDYIKEDIKDGKKVAEDERIKKLVNSPFYINDNIMVGYSFLVDPKDKIVVSPSKIAIDATKKPWADKFPQLAKILHQARENDTASGFYKFYDINAKNSDGAIENKYVSVIKIPGTGGHTIATTVFLNYYVKFTHSQLENYQSREIDSIKQSFSTLTNDKLLTELYSLGIFIVSISVLFIIFAFFIARTISTPIQSLAEKMRRINLDDLKIKPSKKELGITELRELANSFIFLLRKLKVYMRDLRHEVSEREVLNRELDIAREVQDDSLPKVTQDFVRSEFNIYGKLKSAKKVAGDFYDFFYVSEDEMVVMLGDVSGKGISAAYYMSKAKALIKAFCLQKGNESVSPASVLEQVNDILVIDNKSFMFVTIFLGFYNIKTGELKYSNAGHHASIIIGENGSLREFGEHENTILGFLEGSTYKEDKEKLDIGDMLLIYSDGLSEATNVDGEDYDVDKIKISCKKHFSCNTKLMLNEMFTEVIEFEKDKEQNDDITILGLFRK